MSERKVINKYYPPDFDPSKIIKKRKKVKTGSASLPTVRFMTPYSLRCDNCGEYTSKARKFNARKENTEETYLGLKTVKLHIKCPRCASEIIFQTDPKSADYVLIFGAKKLYDSGNTNQKLQDETLEETLSRLEKEEQEEAKLKEGKTGNKTTTVEELEAKLNALRREQEMNEELDEIQQKNVRLQEKSQTIVKSQMEQQLAKQKMQEEEDEKIAQDAFSSKRQTELMNIYKSSDDESNDDSSDESDYDQPINNLIKRPASKVVLKRKANTLGVSIKRRK